MNKDFGTNEPSLYRYAMSTFQPEDSVTREIRIRSLAEGLPEIQLGPMDALHLEILTRLLNPSKVIEIGTLGGYSGTFIARALKPGARLFTIDISKKNADIAKTSFAKAGVSDRAEVFVGPALEVLPSLTALGPFDMMFVDADKENYPHYLRWAEQNLRSGGALIGDNTFAFGEIADMSLTQKDKPSVFALREFNTKCSQGGYFRGTILPTAEGLTVAVKI